MPRHERAKASLLCLLLRVILTVRLVVPTMTTIMAAATAAAALKLVNLFVQAVQFLLRQVPLLFGLLQCAKNAFHIAQHRFQAMPHAIDLSA